MTKSEQLGDVLALRCRGFVIRNRLDLTQGYHGVLRRALFGCRLPNLRNGLGKGTSNLEPLGPALSLLAQGLPIGLTQGEGLAVLAGVGAALVARIGRSS